MKSLFLLSCLFLSLESFGITWEVQVRNKSTRKISSHNPGDKNVKIASFLLHVSEVKKSIKSERVHVTAEYKDMKFSTSTSCWNNTRNAVSATLAVTGKDSVIEIRVDCHHGSARPPQG